MAIVISAPTVRHADDHVTIASRIRLPGREFELFFRGPADAISVEGADPFLAAILVTAMRLGEAVIVEGTIAPSLHRALATVQDVYACWSEEFSVVPVDAGVRTPRASPTAGTASFFSGGVDSFDTVTRHAESLSSLVLVHGFDMPLERTALRARVAGALRACADRLGKRLVEIETNSRSLTDGVVSWNDDQYGPALASVAQLLSPIAGEVLIPSSTTYRALERHGSHPLVDPLWSTDRVTIVHDGASYTRAQKVARLCSVPVAMESLRVCWRNPGDEYNCGRCEKCLRTVANLVAAGALARCRTFDAGGRERLRQFVIEDDVALYFARENVEALRESGADDEVREWIERALRRHEDEVLLQALFARPGARWVQLGGVAARAGARRLRGLLRGRGRGGGHS